jgi:hypothetical protein
VAIHDALWACPFCRRIESIRPGRRDERCTGCGATFAAAAGARILATAPGKAPEARTLEGWERDLPPIEEAAQADAGPAPAILRQAGPALPVFAGRQMLGWAERFGARIPARVSLEEGVLAIRADSLPEIRWRLEEVTAVQPSSSSVQLRRRDRQLLSLAFPEGSIRLWEVRLQDAVRKSYRDAGKGSITEFHPTIRTR